MSRLFRSDVVECFPSVWAADDKGNMRWQPGDVGYSILADVQPSTTDTEPVEGQRVTEIVNVYARALPFTETRYMRIQWRGDWWDIRGAVKFFKQGKATQHVEFSMIKRGARG